MSIKAVPYSSSPAGRSARFTSVSMSMSAATASAGGSCSSAGPASVSSSPSTCSSLAPAPSPARTPLRSMPSSSAARSRASSSSRISARALLGDDVDVERQRLHLLEQDLEGLGDRRLGDVLALDDRLVGLHAPDRVVGLDREHLLQRVRGALRLERPYPQLAEPLAAELGLAAQGLLRDERVRARRASVD